MLELRIKIGVSFFEKMKLMELTIKNIASLTAASNLMVNQLMECEAVATIIVNIASVEE
jgi:hypothetical protein